MSAPRIDHQLAQGVTEVEAGASIRDALALLASYRAGDMEAVGQARRPWTR